MTLPSSGTIKMSEIKAEFGGTNPVGLSDYYGKDGVPSSGTIKFSDFYGKSSFTAYGTKTFTNVGWQDWTVPAGVSSICVVCIGGGGGGGAAVYGGGGGGGGGLTYRNFISVTPGQVMQAYVANGGDNTGRGSGTAGQDSTFRIKSSGVTLCQAKGGGGGEGNGIDNTGRNFGGAGGDAWIDSPDPSNTMTVWGANGGSGYDDWAGGGAGGPGWNNTGSVLAGWGGSRHPSENRDGQAGKNGGGGGGGYIKDNVNGGSSTGRNGYSGGGVGTKQGTTGTGSTGQGNGGSGGANGTNSQGGAYGAGGGGTSEDNQASRRACVGAQGVVRVIWGTGKNFPSNF